MEKLELNAPDLAVMVKAMAPTLSGLTPIMVYYRNGVGLEQGFVWPEGHVGLSDWREPLHLEPLMKNASRPGFCPRGCCFGGLTDNGDLLVVAVPDAFPEKNLPLIDLLWFTLALDIKHRRHIAELNERLEFEKSLIQSPYSGCIILSPDLTVLNANSLACELLGTTEDKLIGGKLTDFVLSKLLISQVFSTGKAIEEHDVHIKLANRDIHIVKTAFPVFGKNGRIIAALDHFREVKQGRQLAKGSANSNATFTFGDIVHESQAMSEAVNLGKMAADNCLSVLITGESGTGKELFAHAIHLASSRRDNPFFVIDCASIPKNLVASELFGYMDGAFTGCKKGGMPGKFELAYGGSVFLDELGELPLDIQPQFLRVLQNKEVRRLGGKVTIPVDVRVIAATNSDLPREIEKGNFREDLYYRLNVLAIHVPPLRERRNDILVLARHFLKKYGRELNKNHLTLSDETQEILLNYSWPGNVRELENMISLAVHLAPSVIEPYHLRFPVRRDPGGQSTLAIAPKSEGFEGEPSVISTIKDIEEKAFRETIAACGGNITKAAKQLGVARSTIYKKISSWN
ncbi:MAG: sigma 54-interacting transcriptional regulator [Deltaproteobacteria bacterium]|jgi:transcriptional regulator with PAS, ATPase and Fis domain|nr:sigma 54-interacting transcriptional regulator [Deltaproteobacteria bacterium]